MRRPVSNLDVMSHQLGMTETEAETALELGARVRAHGITDWELSRMIRWQYSEWARQEEEVQGGNPGLGTLRDWWRRNGD